MAEFQRFILQLTWTHPDSKLIGNESDLFRFDVEEHLKKRPSTLLATLRPASRMKCPQNANVDSHPRAFSTDLSSGVSDSESRNSWNIQLNVLHKTPSKSNLPPNHTCHGLFHFALSKRCDWVWESACRYLVFGHSRASAHGKLYENGNLIW